MGILLGFAPFIVFLFLTRSQTPTVSLLAAAAVAAVLVIRERSRGKSMKILEIGTAVLFAALGLYSWLAHPAWDIPTVRTVVDAGLLFIIVLSLIIRRPFTLQYAREQVPEDLHHVPSFLRTNYVITSIWALALAIILVADLGMHFAPGVPLWIEVVAILSALGGAVWFTKWYPEQQRVRVTSSNLS